MSLTVYIDLTAPVVDGNPGVSIRSAKTLADDGWNATTLELYSHSGTHMDAPIHFGCGETTLDQIPLSRFLSKAWLVDIPNVQPKQLLEVGHLGQTAGKIARGDSLILRTGWAQYAGNAEIFRHGLPRIGEELAEWIVAKGINLVGVEPPSVADVDNLPEVTRIHEILLGGDVIIVEGLSGLEKIHHETFTFGAFPLRIQGGDGCPCRAFAKLPVNEVNLAYGEVLASLPQWTNEDLTGAIREARRSANIVIAVLDDDPTGNQTVHGVSVYTRWDKDALVTEMREGPGLFFLLTNTRAMVEEDAVELTRSTGELLQTAAKEAGCRLLTISRGDSTLRGHYPAEVLALGEGLGIPEAPHVIAPAFQNGGRLTLNGVHFVHEGEELVPAGATPFAQDETFGFSSSNLPDWIAEKTGSRVPGETIQLIDIQTIRKGDPVDLSSTANHIILDAAADRDLQGPALAFLKAIAEGRDFLFRTAADFVHVVAGIEPKPLLEAADLTFPDGKGGLFVVGSHVPKTTRQLQVLMSHPSVVPLEIDVEVLLSESGEAYLEECRATLNESIESGHCVVAYTSRKLKTGRDKQESLRLSLRVSDFLVELVAGLERAPGFLVSKGGITSCELARKALDVGRASVLGQALPGVPVWSLGEGSRYPGLPFVVFPGNVGDDQALLTLANKLL
ncbi:MAG: four-carbon acid sugar kinase family protein [Puniceicoccaceae bacterium]